MPIPETDFTPGVSESSILARLRCFVEESPSRLASLGPLPEDKFAEAAVLESSALAELITFIEKEFGVDVSKFEIAEDNFGSLRSVARFVSGKQPYAVG
jgi:acyl carrier protein